MSQIPQFRLNNTFKILTGSLIMLHTFWTVFVTALDKFIKDDGFPLAGNIAFSVILSAFPFLIFLTTLAGFFGNEALARDVIVYLLSIAPEDIVDPIASEIRSILTVSRSNLLSFSILLTLWTASGSVRSVRTGMNRAYSLDEGRHFLVLLLSDIIFVLVGSAALLTLSLLIIFGPVIWNNATIWVPIIHDFTIWFDWLRFPVALALLTTALIAAHQLLPAQRHRFSEILPGMVFTLIMWLVTAITYAEFLSRFATYASTYAGLAGVIIALMFVYLSGAVLIFCGQINQAYMGAKARSR
jgi:membrane protein